MIHGGVLKIARFFCYVILTVLLAFTVAADAPKNFGEAKRLAKQIFQDNRVTFYCGCKYDKHSKIDINSCGYQVQHHPKRARRLEWEHIMPVSLWGKEYPCWKEKLCCQKTHCYKGRTCCRKSNANFAKIEADLHNLVPEIGELNGMRSNYRFGVLPHIAKGQVGACEFKIDHETRRVEPRNSVKGVIARAYLYMSDQYDIHLSKAQRQLFTAWDREFPPDAWEITWDNRVAAIQGNHNLYISQYQSKQP